MKKQEHLFEDDEKVIRKATDEIVTVKNWWFIKGKSYLGAQYCLKEYPGTWFIESELEKYNETGGTGNMTLEQAILDVITKKMADGSLTKILEDEFEKGVQKAMSNLFGSWGDVQKEIENQIKSVMIPYLETVDYQEYITKLDSVLHDVLKTTALENKTILENFKHLMSPGADKDMKVTELFEVWKKYVAHNVETDGLEICYDDGEPTYYNVEVNFEIEEGEERNWSKYQSATILFTCDHDEEMNIAIPIHTWTDWCKGKWFLDYKTMHDLKSLRNLNEFEVFVMKMTQLNSQVTLDENYASDEVEPEKKPEATFE